MEQVEQESGELVFKILKGTKDVRVVVMENMPVMKSFGKTKEPDLDTKQRKYALMCITRQEELEKEELEKKELEKVEAEFCKKFGLENKKKGGDSFLIAYQRTLAYGKRTEGKYKKYNDNKRKKIRSGVIWDVIKNNFDETNTVFFTLTYDAKHATANDLASCLKDFKKFREKIGRRYDNFRYISIFAQQQNGNWHFHGICNMIGISEQELCKLWGLGRVQKNELTTIKDIQRVTKYLVKNMQSAKDSLQGKKGYGCSQKLIRSQVLRSWNEDESEACIAEFERLKDLPKRILYDVEKTIGAVVQLEYEGGMEERFVAESDITSDTSAHIVERITTRIIAVSVSLPARTVPVLIASKKKK